jgi:VanZ family protein
MLIRLIDRLHKLTLVLFWPGLLLIIWGELRPSAHSPEQIIWDKVLHFTAYFGLALMAGLALRAPRKVMLAVLAVILVGGLLEIVQGFVGRDADIFDEIANSIGALIGAALALAIWKLNDLLVARSSRA